MAQGEHESGGDDEPRWTRLRKQEGDPLDMMKSKQRRLLTIFKAYNQRMAQPTSLLPRVSAAVLAGAPVPLALPLDSVDGSRPPVSHTEPSPVPLSNGDVEQLREDGVNTMDGLAVGRGNLAYAFGSPGPDVAVHLVVRGGSCASEAAAAGSDGAGNSSGAGCAGELPPASGADTKAGAAGNSAQQRGAASQSADPSWLARHGNRPLLLSPAEPAHKTFQRRQACGSETNHGQLAHVQVAAAQGAGASSSQQPQQGRTATANALGSEADECGVGHGAPEAMVCEPQALQQQQQPGSGNMPDQHPPTPNRLPLAQSQSHTAPPPPPPLPPQPTGPGVGAVAHEYEAAAPEDLVAQPTAPVVEPAAGAQAKPSREGGADVDEDEDDVVCLGTPGTAPTVSQDAAAWLRGEGRPKSSQRTHAGGGAGGVAGPSGRTEASALKQQRSILQFVRPSASQGRAGVKAARTGGRGLCGGGRAGGRSGLAGLGSWGGSQPQSARLDSPARITGARTGGGIWEQEGCSQPPQTAPSAAQQQAPWPGTHVPPALRPPSGGGSLFGSQAGRAASASLGAAAASHGRQSGGGPVAGSRLGRQGSGAVPGAAAAAGVAAAHTSFGGFQVDDSDDDDVVEEASSKQPGDAPTAGGGTSCAGEAVAAAAATAGVSVAEAVRRGADVEVALDVDMVPASCVPDSYAGLLTQGATLAGTCCPGVAAPGAPAHAGAGAAGQLPALGVAGGSEEEVVPATPLSVQGSELPASALAGASLAAEGPLSVRSGGAALRAAGGHAADLRAATSGPAVTSTVHMVAATPLPSGTLQHLTGVGPPLPPGLGGAVMGIAATPEHALCDAGNAALPPAERSGGATPAPDAPLLTAGLSTAPAAAAAPGPSCAAPAAPQVERAARVLHHGRLVPRCTAAAAASTPGGGAAAAVPIPGAQGAAAPAEPGHDELLHPGLVLEVHVGTCVAQAAHGSCQGGTGTSMVAGGGSSFVSCLVLQPEPQGAAGPDAVTPAGAAVVVGPGAEGDASGEKNNACAVAEAGPPAGAAGRGQSSSAARPQQTPEGNTTPRPTAHQRRRLQSLPSVAGAASAAAVAGAPRPARRLLMLYNWAVPVDGPPQLHSVLPLSAPCAHPQALATPGIPATPSPLPAGMAAAAGGGGSSSGGGGDGAGPQVPAGVGHALQLLVSADGSPALLLAGQLRCAAAAVAGADRRSPSTEPAGNNGGRTASRGGGGGPLAASLCSPLPTAAGCSGTSGGSDGRADGGVQLLRYSDGVWRTSCTLQPPPLDTRTAGRSTSGGGSCCPPGAQAAAAAATMLCVSAAACVARGRQRAGGASVYWQVVAAGERGHGFVWRLPAGLTGAALQQARLPQARYKHSLPLNDVVELRHLPGRAHLVLGASSDGCVVLWDVGRPHALRGAGTAGGGGGGFGFGGGTSSGVVLGAVAPPAVLLTVARPVDCVLRGLQPVDIASGPRGRHGVLGAGDGGAAAAGGEEEESEEEPEASFAARTAGWPVVFLATTTSSWASGAGLRRLDGAQGTAGARVMPVLLRDGAVDVGQALSVPDATCVSAGCQLGAVGTSGGHVVVWNPLAGGVVAGWQVPCAVTAVAFMQEWGRPGGAAEACADENGASAGRVGGLCVLAASGRQVMVARV